MKKVKYNEVPKDYRRNYKKEAVELLQAFALCLCAILFFAIIIFC